jgi:hypothetical protein
VINHGAEVEPVGRVRGQGEAPRAWRRE